MSSLPEAELAGCPLLTPVPQRMKMEPECHPRPWNRSVTQPQSALMTNPSLLIRLRDAKDTQAWGLFVDLYGPVVFRACRRKGLQEADATDVTQEVLIEVVHSIRRFVYDPERGRFRDWLWTIAQRRLGRHFSRRGEIRALPLTEESVARRTSQSADPQWSADFNARVLEMALERARPNFEPATWEAFKRVWIDDHPAAAVAAEMQVPIEHVYLSKSRVLRRLEAEVRLLADDLPQTVPLR